MNSDNDDSDDNFNGGDGGLRSANNTRTTSGDTLQLTSSSTSGQESQPSGTNNGTSSTTGTKSNCNLTQTSNLETSSNCAYHKVMRTIDASLHRVQPWNNVATLRHFIYDDLFRKVKFIESREFTNPASKLAVYVMSGIGVPDIHHQTWWEANHTLVKKFTSIKRSGVIQNLSIVYRGKSSTNRSLFLMSAISHILSFDFDHTDIHTHSEFPSFNQLQQIHEHVNSYKLLIETMLPVVVGRPTWRKRITSMKISELATPSDEAFLFVALMNSTKRWDVKIATMNERAKGNINILPSNLFTNGPQVTDSFILGGKKRSGWSVDGRLEFVRFHHATVAFRKTKNYSDIEDSVKNKWIGLGKKYTKPGMNMPPLPMDF